MKKITTLYDEHSSLSRIKHQLNIVYGELHDCEASFEFTNKMEFFAHVEGANDPQAEFTRWQTLSKRR